MVVVRWRIGYSFVPDWEEPYRAEIQLILPIDENGYLHPAVCSHEHILWGDRLYSHVGEKVEGGRRFRYWVLAASADEVKRKAHQKLDEALQVVKEAACRNGYNIVVLPDDEIGKFYLCKSG